VASLLDKFAHLYDPEWLSKRGAVWSIDDFGEKAGLGKDLTTRYGAEWARKVGMGDKWIGEVMEGSTRVNVSGAGLVFQGTRIVSR
jgi:prenylcysteine oxidase/farnesylcysteine lyase